MNRPNGQQCLAKTIELKEAVHEELDGSTDLQQYNREMSDKSQTDRLMDNMQFFIWHGSQNLCQTITLYGGHLFGFAIYF